MVRNPTSKNGFSAIQLRNSSVCSGNNVNSPKINLQEADINSCQNNSPLGLRLDKTQAFINLVEAKLSEARKTPAKMESEKLKASNISATFIKIGNWEVMARTEGHVVAKCYYAKKKIVWEILEGALKRKIEIHWADIIGINAVIKDNESGVLLIELGSPPAYYRESDPMPRKHTVWQQASDFTGGQAPLHRRHLLIFPPGVLDRHYERLLQFDRRLFELSLKPFPTEKNQYFYSNIYSYTPYPSNFTGSDNKLAFNVQYDVTKFPAPHHDENYEQTALPLGTVDSSSPTSERNCGLENQMAILCTPHISNSLGQSRTMEIKGSCYTYPDCHQIAYGEDSGIAMANGEIPMTEIEQHLLGDSEVVDSDEADLLTGVHSLNSFTGESIIASQMMSENGYFGYCSGSSSKLLPYEDDVKMTMNPPSNQLYSAHVLPVHEYKNVSSPFQSAGESFDSPTSSQGMCFWP